MSAVATFTLRDLNRRPAKVLEAVRKFGFVEVCARSGEVFTLAPKAPRRNTSKAGDFPDFYERWKRMRRFGYTPPPDSENGRIDRIIAGEE
jgi:antitoxin (DNA-binding transcriptional repressor) of toxin-antitoxin stability system